MQAAPALLPETLHIPIHHFLLHKRLMHPIAALCLSLLFLALWLYAGFSSFFAAYGEVVPSAPHGAWFELLTAIAALQWSVAGFYCAYLGAAAVAVHRWRIGRKGKKGEEENERTARRSDEESLKK